MKSWCIFLAGDEINRACNLFNSGLRFQHDFEPPNLLTPICQRAKRGKWERHRIRESFHFSYEIIFLDIHAEESVIQAVKSRLSFARKSPTNEDHENLRKITDFFWALGPQVILLPGIKLTPGRGTAWPNSCLSKLSLKIDFPKEGALRELRRAQITIKIPG